jgi:ribosomal protein S12 methylthiotransferase
MFTGKLPKVYLLSLGCFKNTVDSEGMLWELEREGFELTEAPEEAGIILVNTCAFIDPAKEESVDAVLEAAALKTGGSVRTLVVAGCLVQRYRKELEKLIPEVDLYVDLEGEEGIGKALKEKLNLPPVLKKTIGHRGRSLLTPPHLSFLKISEGCSRHCTFCTIPFIRGRLRSKDTDELIEEAQNLEARGVKELNIISQDTVSYRDSKGRGLSRFLQTLLSRTSIPWIRLLYLNPAGLEDNLLDLLATEERLLGYIDIPIQHISDPVLKSMGREARRNTIEELLSRLRERVPEVTIRTTVMVGFPGEGEEHFRELLDFIEQVEFDRLGVFAYSCEDGTPASRLGGQIAEEIKQDRCAQVMELQSAISRGKCHMRRGEITTVLVDSEVIADDLRAGLEPSGMSREDIGFVGRSKREAYEVDGVIYLSGDFTVGEFNKVRIEDSTDYDLYGIWA